MFVLSHNSSSILGWYCTNCRFWSGNEKEWENEVL